MSTPFFPANTPDLRTTPPFSANAFLLITEAEGLDQPGKWPGGDSGITLGHGYDLSAEPANELRRDWAPYLSGGEIGQLLGAIGKSGEAAAALAHDLRNITVTREQADAVFLEATLPKYLQLTRVVYPHLSELPLDAQGALVSIIYNRGTAMGKPGLRSWDDRREMRAIQADLAAGVHAGDLAKIAALIRSMKRLWEGKGLDGLIARREAEAQLVERADS